MLAPRSGRARSRPPASPCRSVCWDSRSDALPSARPSTVSVRAGRGDHRVQRAAALGVVLRGEDLGVGQPAHQRRQVLAVPVDEDLPLRLAVVGQHHEVVLPGGHLGDGLELREHRVDALERGQRLRLHDPGVVRDRVVVDVVHVDRASAAEHRVGDQRGVQVAHHAAEGGPLAGESPAAVHPRAYVAPLRARRLEPLARDLAEGAGHAPRDAAGPGEEPRQGEPRLPGLLGAVDRAHGRVRRGGVAGEQVADRDPVVDEQPAAVRVLRLDRGGIGRLVGDVHPALGAVDPAERGDPLDGAVQDAHLAGRRGRGELGPPLGHAGGSRCGSTGTSVGSVPARTPQSSTGNGTPSAWTNTMPGRSASARSGGRLRRAPRSRLAVTASSVPAVATQTKSVDRRHDPGRHEGGPERRSLSSGSGRARPDDERLAEQPDQDGAHPAEQGQRRRPAPAAAAPPKTKMSTARPTHCQKLPMLKSGTTHEATTSPSAAPSRPSRARPRSPHRSAQRRRGSRALAMGRAWRDRFGLLLPRTG